MGKFTKVLTTRHLWTLFRLDQIFNFEHGLKFINRNLNNDKPKIYSKS